MHLCRLKSCHRNECEPTFQVLTASEVNNVPGRHLRVAVLLLLGVSVLMPLAVQAQSAEPAAGAVQGTVSIADDNDPIAVSGARVVIYGETEVTSTVTDREGKFSFSGLAPGVYFLEAIHLGLRAKRSIRIEAGEVVQVALQFEPHGPARANR